MASSVPSHVFLPALSRWRQDRIIINWSQEQELGDVRGVVVPAGSVGSYMGCEMPQVIQGAPSSVKEWQQLLEGDHAICKQLSSIAVRFKSAKEDLWVNNYPVRLFFFKGRMLTFIHSANIQLTLRTSNCNSILINFFLFQVPYFSNAYTESKTLLYIIDHYTLV